MRVTPSPILFGFGALAFLLAPAMSLGQVKGNYYELRPGKPAREIHEDYATSKGALKRCVTQGYDGRLGPAIRNCGDSNAQKTKKILTTHDVLKQQLKYGYTGKYGNAVADKNTAKLIGQVLMKQLFSQQLMKDIEFLTVIDEGSYWIIHGDSQCPRGHICTRSAPAIALRKRDSAILYATEDY